MPSLRPATPLLALILAACASYPPEGPSVMALPGTGQSFDRFRAADANCRNYANLTLGGSTPAQAGVEAGVASAAVGTVIGAAIGAAVDGSSGAAVGAGVGLLAGSASGAASSNASSYALQQRYDQSYVQCMYARGQRVPVIGGFSPQEGYATSDAAPQPPAPPRGAPPPPPPPRGAAPPPPR
ncbi:glycine zipper family protein [Candidatus Accumulibacter sp. ACC003]|uniref:glycine zipper family protein n=1 Tax=Candidatus Accumulibacter sp. ACC003 TaxID=2823334 RepID=UPI0025C02B85|nr:glycine zipper family protein [Candidatus Accumulibacter sp. ACC003]